MAEMQQSQITACTVGETAMKKKNILSISSMRVTAVFEFTPLPHSQGFLFTVPHFVSTPAKGDLLQKASVQDAGRRNRSLILNDLQNRGLHSVTVLLHIHCQCEVKVIKVGELGLKLKFAMCVY